MKAAREPAKMIARFWRVVKTLNSGPDEAGCSEGGSAVESEGGSGSSSEGSFSFETDMGAFAEAFGDGESGLSAAFRSVVDIGFDEAVVPSGSSAVTVA